MRAAQGAARNPQEALQREITEELGCTIRVGEKIITSEYHYDFATVRLSVFYCTLDSGKPQRSTHKLSTCRCAAQENKHSVDT